MNLGRQFNVYEISDISCKNLFSKLQFDLFVTDTAKMQEVCPLPL